MKRYFKVLAFLFMIGLVACEYDYIPKEEIDLPDPDPINPTSFETKIEPIFQEKCITCHNSTDPILITGSAFANLTNGGHINTSEPADSKVYKKAKDGHSGSSNKMNPDELDLLLKWIVEGAKDN